jgi:hypothetical protein
LRGTVKLTLNRINNLSFAPAAVQYRRRWFSVTTEFVDRLWPLMRARLRRTRPEVHEDQQSEDRAD